MVIGIVQICWHKMKQKYHIMVRVSEEERVMLKEIRDNLKINISDFVRASIRNLYRVKITNKMVNNTTTNITTSEIKENNG